MLGLLHVSDGRVIWTEFAIDLGNSTLPNQNICKILVFFFYNLSVAIGTSSSVSPNTHLWLTTGTETFSKS